MGLPSTGIAHNQIYTHVDDAAKRDAITKLHRLLGGSDD
jgi:hypothetical protein